jgi:Myosin head (motor domain)
VRGMGSASNVDTKALCSTWPSWACGQRQPDRRALRDAQLPHFVQYLAFLGGYAAEGSFGGGADGAASAGVESKVLESNPLLEAFGNAKTVRNYNSSRFGKFTEIQFDAQWRIVGAAVRTYLLERSRVVAVNDPERNYHVFYQLCAGASDVDRARLHLQPPQEFRCAAAPPLWSAPVDTLLPAAGTSTAARASTFPAWPRSDALPQSDAQEAARRYLNRSSCFDLPGMDNEGEYAATRHAMSVVGIPHGDQQAIFTVVAAVLHLGNATFTANPRDDGTCLLESERAKQHLMWAAELLQARLVSCICLGLLGVKMRGAHARESERAKQRLVRAAELLAVFAVVYVLPKSVCVSTSSCRQLVLHVHAHSFATGQSRVPLQALHHSLAHRAHACKSPALQMPAQGAAPLADTFRIIPPTLAEDLQARLCPPLRCAAGACAGAAPLADDEDDPDAGRPDREPDQRGGRRVQSRLAREDHLCAPLRLACRPGARDAPAERVVSAAATGVRRCSKHGPSTGSVTRWVPMQADSTTKRLFTVVWASRAAAFECVHNARGMRMHLAGASASLLVRRVAPLRRVGVVLCTMLTAPSCAQVNKSIGQVESPKALVGVLDIYGFEQFKTNDFEQFCINLANEKLQQHFNQHVFKMEQAEYEAEAIDWTTIEFVDNQAWLGLCRCFHIGSGVEWDAGGQSATHSAVACLTLRHVRFASP